MSEGLMNITLKAFFLCFFLSFFFLFSSSFCCLCWAYSSNIGPRMFWRFWKVRRASLLQDQLEEGMQAEMEAKLGKWSIYTVFCPDPIFEFDLVLEMNLVLFIYRELVLRSGIGVLFTTDQAWGAVLPVCAMPSRKPSKDEKQHPDIRVFLGPRERHPVRD